MLDNTFLNADDVAKKLGRSKAYAYKIIKSLNKELERNGYRTVSGKISSKYFEEKYYGLYKGGK